MPIRFQVDPDFYDHPKVLGMSDAAFALWVRAGSYSAAKLVDGFIADDALSLFSETQKQAAGELVRRGLWRRVKGGFQFHQYGDRNLTRDRVHADREADRERKRATRRVTATSRVCDGCGDTYVTARSDSKYCSKACRQRAYREREPQVETENVRVESTPESGRNPDGIHPVSVSVSVSESVSGSGRVARPSPTAGSDPDQPPPPRCPEHADDPNPPPCGPCADHRRARERWDRDQAAARAAAQSERARQHAAAVRAAIDACHHCDEHGKRDGRTCLHDPDLSTRSRRGVAVARAAIRPRETP